MTPLRVLHDADVVDEREQVVGAHPDALTVDHAPPTAACAARARPPRASTAAVAVGDRRPGELVADPPRLGPGRGEQSRAARCSGRPPRRARRGRRTARASRRRRRACPGRTSTGSRRRRSRRRGRRSARPDEICSRSRYGVTNTSVAASRSAISSMLRNRSSNSTWSSRPRSTTARSSVRRYRSPSRRATSGCVRPAIT